MRKLSGYKPRLLFGEEYDPLGPKQGCGSARPTEASSTEEKEEALVVGGDGDAVDGLAVNFSSKGPVGFESSRKILGSMGTSSVVLGSAAVRSRSVLAAFALSESVRCLRGDMVDVCS